MTSPSLPTARVLDRYQASVAGRLLAGAGAAVLVAYRHDPNVAHQVLAHGLTDAGELVVAVSQDVVTAEGCEIRLDIVREAAEPRLRITAATAHLLGQLTVLPVTLFEARGVPEAIAELAGVPGIAVGVVRCDRVLLHHGPGVVRLRFADVAVAAFPSHDDELEVQGVVAGFATEELLQIAAAVGAGRLDGAVLSQRPTIPMAVRDEEQMYCVDVDSQGLTLMRVAEVTTVTFIAFPEPVGDAMDVFLALIGLVMRARS